MARSLRADWNWKDQPLYQWVGYHQHNAKIAWKVYADHIEVLQLSAPRMGVMRTTASVMIRQRNGHQTLPDTVQNKIIHFLEQLPHLDFEQAKQEATRTLHDSEVSKHLFLEVQDSDDHIPQRIPVVKIEMPTADGELVATSREFKVIIRARHETPGDRDVTYFASVKGDLQVALDWVRQNKQRVSRMKGRDIVAELRHLGFKGDWR